MEKPRYNAGGHVDPHGEYDETGRLVYSNERIEKMEKTKKYTVIVDMDEYEMLLSGKSNCCGAAIDTQHTIKSGKHKGHGPRFCGKCGKLLFMV